MDIALRIKELRKNAQISQAELAKSIGVSSGNVGDWERGRVKPGADALISLMNYFNVSADWLLTGQSFKDIPEKKEAKSGMNATIVLSDEELDMIVKYRQLDSRDQEDAWDNIDSKFRRMVKKGTSSSSATGGTGEEAAISDIA